MKASHICAFIGGATVGAILALLLAPDSGRNTRTKIDQKLRERGIVLDSERLDEFIEKMKEYFHISEDGNVVFEDDADGSNPSK